MVCADICMERLCDDVSFANLGTVPGGVLLSSIS